MMASVEWPRHGRALAIGRALRADRESAGLSVRELAMASGLSKGAVERAERGTRMPSRAELEALCSALDRADAAGRALTLAELRDGEPYEADPLARAGARYAWALGGMPLHRVAHGLGLTLEEAEEAEAGALRKLAAAATEPGERGEAVRAFVATLAELRGERDARHA